MSDQTKMNNVEFYEQTEEHIITLTDNEGNPVDFYEVACVELEGAFYVLLQPLEDMEDIASDEAAIFQVTEEGDEEVFEPLESVELMERVFNEYLKALADLNSEDGCDCGDEDCDCHGHDCDCEDEDCDCKSAKN